MKKTMICVICCAVSFVAGCTSGTRAVASMPGEQKHQEPTTIVCRLSVATSKSPFILKVTINNPTSVDLHVYKLFAPATLQPVTSVFKITLNGKAVEYEGAVAKLPFPPPPADLIRLAPGQSLSFEFPVERFYDMKSAGEYRVRYEAEHPQPDGSGIRLVSNEVSLKK